MIKKIVYFWSFLVTILFTNSAFAQNFTSGNKSSPNAALAIGAGIGIGIAALGGAIGQGKVGAAALEGIARNPEAAGKIQTPMIIAFALIESLVIYVLVIAFLLQGKI